MEKDLCGTRGQLVLGGIAALVCWFALPSPVNAVMFACSLVYVLYTLLMWAKNKVTPPAPLFAGGSSYLVVTLVLYTFMRTAQSFNLAQHS